MPNSRILVPHPAPGLGWAARCVAGWAVLAISSALVAAGAVVLLPWGGQLVFVGCAVVLCLLLVGVCRLQGEPPRWRSKDH